MALGAATRSWHAGFGRGPSRKAMGEAQQVSDRIRSLSDLPSARKWDNPGRPPRNCREEDLPRVGRLRAEDAAGLPGAKVRLRKISGGASSSCGASFSPGEGSSGAESSPGSDWQSTHTDNTAGPGAASTKTSHVSRDARHN